VRRPPTIADSNARFLTRALVFPDQEFGSMRMDCAALDGIVDSISSHAGRGGRFLSANLECRKIRLELHERGRKPRQPLFARRFRWPGRKHAAGIDKFCDAGILLHVLAAQVGKDLQQNIAILAKRIFAAVFDPEMLIEDTAQTGYRPGTQAPGRRNAAGKHRKLTLLVRRD
jgi:hypothetical protein